MSPHEMAHRERFEFFRWLVLIGVMNMVILGILSFGLISNFNSTTNDIKTIQHRQTILAAKLKVSNLASCERGSAVVARDIIDAGQNAKNPKERQLAAFKVLKFRDCLKTENTGKIVRLSTAETNALIDGIAEIMGIEDWDKRKD